MALKVWYEISERYGSILTGKSKTAVIASGKAGNGENVIAISSEDKTFLFDADELLEAVDALYSQLEADQE